MPAAGPAAASFPALTGFVHAGGASLVESHDKRDKAEQPEPAKISLERKKQREYDNRRKQFHDNYESSAELFRHVFSPLRPPQTKKE